MEKFSFLPIDDSWSLKSFIPDESEKKEQKQLWSRKLDKWHLLGTTIWTDGDDLPSNMWVVQRKWQMDAYIFSHNSIKEPTFFCDWCLSIKSPRPVEWPDFFRIRWITIGTWETLFCEKKRKLMLAVTITQVLGLSHKEKMEDHTSFPMIFRGIRSFFQSLCKETKLVPDQI